CERSPLVIESVKDYLKGEFISVQLLKAF
ncbi:hypothetical protein AAUPMB_16155, partial [Pasteurella multocida subsp. multocida str. Anand1_buffalo]